MDLFRCISPELPPTRLTREACGKRYREARKLNGSASADRVLTLGPCRGCPVGQAHARGEAPDVRLVQVAARGTPGGPRGRDKGAISMPAGNGRPVAAWRASRECALPGCEERFEPTMKTQRCCKLQHTLALKRLEAGTPEPTPKAALPEELTCAHEECGRRFKPVHPKQKHCKRACSNAAYYRRHHPKAKREARHGS